jgi:riboflavin synthase
MFTGIVQAVGRIARVEGGPSAARLTVDTGALDVTDVRVGDSIAVDGCCLTVVAIASHDGRPAVSFDVSHETLRCTVGLDAPGPVNLEKALRLADRLGGHLVTGHVDGVGTVAAIERIVDGADAGSRRLAIDVPTQLARFIATKGSVAVRGVSLTVNGVAGTTFDVNLIPHTLAVTTLGTLGAGDRVNVEVDLVARYVERLREAAADGAARR